MPVSVSVPVSSSSLSSLDTVVSTTLHRSTMRGCTSAAQKHLQAAGDGELAMSSIARGTT